MILINSAAYIISEFRTEFGMLPPCFLPLGNKKLLEYQVKYLREAFNDQIIVSLPNDYELNINEINLFEQLNISYITIPNDFSLGMAILYVLSSIDQPSNSPIRMLHGDTLLKSVPSDNDIVGVAITEDSYNWEFDTSSGIDNLVWCGYFSFSSYHKFMQTLTLAQGNFIDAVRMYADRHSLSRKVVDGWLDFGHVNTYFKSRSLITTERAFNNLKISNGVVWKSGMPEQKIYAESEWFSNIPHCLKKYIPQLIFSGLTDYNKPFYELEYLPYLPLNEIFVHGKNDYVFWNKISERVKRFLAISREAFPINDKTLISKVTNDAKRLYAKKTYERLNEFVAQKSISINQPFTYGGNQYPSILSIADECIAYNENLPLIPSVLHGDLCFSNILFDSRMDDIKVIDPRGLNLDKELTIYGDQKYDLAKLCHSFIGMYDFIIADSFYLENDQVIFNEDARTRDIQECFLNTELIPGLKNIDILPLTILLFLSMPPLHFDKPCRQDAMLLNAIRLYALWKEKQ